MKLFKCHAVMPSVVGRGSYLVRTYVVIASTWQEARARVWNKEPRAEFVTMPGEVAEAIRRRYGKDRTFSVPILTVLKFILFVVTLHWVS